MGVAGSALGTVLAQWASLGVYVAVVLSRSLRLGVAVGPSLSGMKRSLFGSAPLFLRNVSLRIVVFASAAIAADMGTAQLAAHQVAFNIWSALALGLDAIAIAGQALVGRYLGASDASGAREASRRMVEWSFGMGAVLGIVIFATRNLLPPLFTDDAEVQPPSDMLIVVAVMQPWAGWVFALDGVLIGAGDVRYVAFAQLLTIVFSAARRSGAAWTSAQGLWWALAVWVLARLAVWDSRAGPVMGGGRSFPLTRPLPNRRPHRRVNDLPAVVVVGAAWNVHGVSAALPCGEPCVRPRRCRSAPCRGELPSSAR